MGEEGPWQDSLLRRLGQADDALSRWVEEKDSLLAGMVPRSRPAGYRDTLTLEDLITRFLIRFVKRIPMYCGPRHDWANAAMQFVKTL